MMNEINEKEGEKNAEQPACCDYKTLVGVFKALSDQTRQKILLTLEDLGETRVSDLVDRLGISQPTMSHHLGVLKNTGLVEDRRDGQSIYYRVNRIWLTECCSGFISRFEDDE
ncbi:MAG: metalloregulator ArsR/SmtB family transcription factor [Thermoleophilia bacterium]|jgi:DNA-binding transcriptional ArsR family regulator